MENTGNGSTGDKSTGDWSTGNGSTGNGSTGNGSTGNWSTGNRSTGNGSTGNGSTGNWSISDYSTGHFSTIDYSGFGAFNKPCTPKDWEEAIKPNFISLDMTKWIKREDMTEIEKKDNPKCETTGGYLKVLDYKEAWAESWENATEEDKELLYNLPNFDKEVFKEISGIDIEENIKELSITDLQKILGYKIKIKE